jgi:hypothetical protein
LVRAPEGSGCVERAIRTLKEQPLSVKNFETVREPGLALLQWAEPHKEHWRIKRMASSYLLNDVESGTHTPDKSLYERTRYLHPRVQKTLDQPMIPNSNYLLARLNP